MSRETPMRPVVLESVRFFGPIGRPPMLAMLLRAEDEDDRYLPIWVGRDVGQAIYAALFDVQSPRPQTHDLLKSAIERSGGMVKKVAVVDRRDQTYYAVITVDSDSESRAIDSRPSDAIALAARCGCPIEVSERVLEEDGVTLRPVSGIVELRDGGAAALRLDGPSAASLEAATIDLQDDLVEQLSLKDGDHLTGLVAIDRSGEPSLAPIGVESVNGEVASFGYDLSRWHVPLTLFVPNDWFAPFPGLFQPFGVEFAELALFAGEHDSQGLDATGVLERILADSQGAYERLEEDGRFELPAGFEATMLTSARKTLQIPPGGDTLTDGLYSLEGATIRWLVAVRGDRVIHVGLEALDWDRWASLESLLSRVQLHGTETDPGGLTGRELEVLKHIADGATNAQIAERLEISPHTVNGHVRSILAKLEAANRTQAASQALARGIIEDGSRN